MIKKNSYSFLFVNNNTFSGKGLSGGDRIWTELMRNWSHNNQVDLLGSEGAKQMANNHGISQSKYIVSAPLVENTNLKDLLSPLFLFAHTVSRTLLGCLTVIKHIQEIKSYQYVYSVSDFYPDLFPSVLIKLIHPKTKWIAGYYLFAPLPFSSESPYKGSDRLKGLLYWLMQIPSFLIAKYFADIIFVTSEPDVDKFITTKRDRSKIFVIQGGVVTSFADKYFKQEKPIPTIKRKYDACFVGRFHQQKGVLGLIDIWKEVVKIRPKAKLIMIGNGGQKSFVKSKIKRLHLKNNITLRGFLDGEPKHQIFKQSKIVVHPAIYDSGGMAAAEAMAWGLPGVSFDLEALKTYYPKGMLKTPIGDNKKFAQNILKLIKSPSLYRQTSRDARNLIKKVWNWEKRANKILKAVIR